MLNVNEYLFVILLARLILLWWSQIINRWLWLWLFWFWCADLYCDPIRDLCKLHINKCSNIRRIKHVPLRLLFPKFDLLSPNLLPHHTTGTQKRHTLIEKLIKIKIIFSQKSHGLRIERKLLRFALGQCERV